MTKTAIDGADRYNAMALCGPIERTNATERIALDVEAGQLSAELVRRGIAAETRVHVVVEVWKPSMAASAEAGGAFDWLEAEPDLYTDSDLMRQTD